MKFLTQTVRGVASKTTFGKDDKGVYVMLNPKDYWNIAMLAITSKETTRIPYTKASETTHEKIIETSTNPGDYGTRPIYGEWHDPRSWC